MSATQIEPQNGGGVIKKGSCAWVVDFQRYQAEGDPNDLGLVPTNSDTDARYIDKETSIEWYWSIDGQVWLPVQTIPEYGEMWSTVVRTTDFTTTPVKLDIVTAAGPSFGFSMTQDNRLAYTGTSTGKVFKASLTGSGNGQDNANVTYSFYISKNGLLEQRLRQVVTAQNNIQTKTLAITANIQLDPDDYLEVWADDIDQLSSGWTQLDLRLVIGDA